MVVVVVVSRAFPLRCDHSSLHVIRREILSQVLQMESHVQNSSALIFDQGDTCSLSVSQSYVVTVTRCCRFNLFDPFPICQHVRLKFHCTQSSSLPRCLRNNKISTISKFYCPFERRSSVTKKCHYLSLPLRCRCLSSCWGKKEHPRVTH